MSRVNPMLRLAYPAGHDPGILNDNEIRELRTIAERHRAARIARNYGAVEELRAELEAWGAWPPEKGRRPADESPKHRQTRLARRKE